MPTMSSPCRRSIAAAIARVRLVRNRRSSKTTDGTIDSRYRIVAFLLITALAFPLLLIQPSGVGARSRLTTIAPISAPPDRFVVKQAETRAVASVLPSAIETLSSLFARPNLPAGFESAKLPTRTEQIVSNLRPVLGLITSSRSAIPNPKSEIEPPPPPSGTVLFDFDGDGKADIGRWQSSSTEFKVRNSGDSSYSTHTIGSSSAIPAPGDFDGDGKTDAAVFNAGSWTIKKSSNGTTQNISFGTTGDKPVAADYDGDGITDAAVFRPSTNVWWILRSSDSNYTSTTFGSSGDILMTGNWDGDSYADIAVFRPSNGNWYVQRSTAGSMQLAWGLKQTFRFPPTSTATTRPT